VGCVDVEGIATPKIGFATPRQEAVLPNFGSARNIVEGRPHLTLTN